SKKTITISLNATGRALLAKFYKLRTTVTVGGTTAITAHLTFSYKKIKALILYTANWNGHGIDTISKISVTGIPKHAAVKFFCLSGSCSPRSQSFKVKRSRLSLGNTTITLKPKATVEFEVTLKGEVGHILEITDVGSGPPTQSVLCLPPGA